MDGPSRPKVKQCCQAVETPVALHEVHTHNTRGEREEMYKYETLTIKRPHRFLLLLPGPSKTSYKAKKKKMLYEKTPRWGWLLLRPSTSRSSRPPEVRCVSNTHQKKKGDLHTFTIIIIFTSPSLAYSDHALDYCKCVLYAGSRCDTSAVFLNLKRPSNLSETKQKKACFLIIKWLAAVDSPFFSSQKGRKKNVLGGHTNFFILFFSYNGRWKKWHCWIVFSVIPDPPLFFPYTFYCYIKKKRGQGGLGA